MKNKNKVLYGLIIMLAGIIHFPAQAQQKQDAKAVVYRLDVSKSKLLWSAPKNGRKGFILFNSGTLGNVTAGWPTRGAFSINMNSMRNTDKATEAGRKEVDDQLRSEEFFAVSRYPAATMMVSRIIPQSNRTTFRVYGMLTIKGVTKPIEFTAIMKQNGHTITATASTQINRENWNIGQPPQASWNPLGHLKDHLIASDILVRLELVFARK